MSVINRRAIRRRLPIVAVLVSSLAGIPLPGWAQQQYVGPAWRVEEVLTATATARDVRPIAHDIPRAVAASLDGHDDVTIAQPQERTGGRPGRGALIGALIGGGAGAGIGYGLARHCAAEEWPSCKSLGEGAVLGAAVGGGVGALIGWLIGR